MYQQTLSNWYGESAGQKLTKARVQDLIQDLQKVTTARVREHRKWLRQNMHKWWQGRWVGPTPIYPPLVQHQRRTTVETTLIIEDSEQVSGQPGSGVHIVKNLL